MVSKSRNFSLITREWGSAASKFFCNLGEYAHSSVLISKQRRRIPGDRCSGAYLEVSSVSCPPSIPVNSTGIEEDIKRRLLQSSS